MLDCKQSRDSPSSAEDDSNAREFLKLTSEPIFTLLLLAYREIIVLHKNLYDR
jgi:hypothetical protein